MRIESSVTSVSWIPSEAVTGPMLKGTFESGFTHYDDPPPDVIDDLEALAAAGTASASPTTCTAWIEVEDGQIVDAGYSGGGLMGATTVRLGQAARHVRAGRRSPTSATSPRSPRPTVRFVQTTGGRTGLPAPRRVKHPPFVQFTRADGVDHARAHDPRRRHVELRGARREQVPPPLGLRRRRRARGQGRPRRLQGLVPRRVRQAHAVGRRGLAGARHRGRDRARAPAVGHDHARRRASPRSARSRRARTSSQQGDPGDELFLLLDGVLSVVVDGEAVAELGPGAVLGERAVLEGGRPHRDACRRRTDVRVAVAPADQIDRERAARSCAEHHRVDETGARERVTFAGCASRPGTSTR